MNDLFRNWLYILVIISIAYWIIVGGIILFPNINPIFISIIALIVIYIISNQQSFVLLF